jgi:hypothetical protein
VSSYYHGKLAKPKTTHVDHGIIRPSREFFPLLKRVLKNQRRHAVLQVRVACSMVHCQFFCCADEVRRGTDGGIYLLVSCVFGVVACLRRLCWLDLCSCSLLGPLVCWDEGQQGQTICHCGTVRPATVTHSQPASWPTDQP